MKIINDIEEARSTVLRRIPIELEGSAGEGMSPGQLVEQIITQVRARGDDALTDYARQFDGCVPESLEVSREEIAAASSRISPELLDALKLAARRIKDFHLNHKRNSWIDYDEGGLGQWIRPLERVGLYVPGGRASYPSTLLMSAIPARVAGVKEIIVVTPSKGGKVLPATLAAADIAGVDRVFSTGGAQAVAALAYGTQTIPRVDKICGPGNIYVQIAKKMVYGTVDIDGMYGPTETMVIADETADPAVCAADLLSQAEHDPLASAIMITTSPELALKVSNEAERQLNELERREIAAASLERNGCIIVVSSLDQAADLANEYAPEHLLLMIKDAWPYVEKLKNAGGIFIGESSPEVIGDYVAGPSHIMPTGGAARYNSPVTVDDFLKVTSIVAVNSQTFEKIAPAAVTIARAEGLEAHARAVEIRVTKTGQND